MKAIARRIKRIEDRLNIGKKQVIITALMFGGELPPDRRVGDTIIRHVMFEGKVRQ